MAKYTPASLNPKIVRKPEVLAPAGDLESLKAALASGADAVYFGLDDGFNARARANNFTLAELPDTVALIHRAGVRAYLTLNTLVFETELERVESIIRDVALSGMDAIIVQDPAVALIAQALCPELEIHASTQMTISSPEGARFAESVGVMRVVVPRELSVAEIEKFAAKSDLELEVFIHGALCMSWSGQCLTSRVWGGRSANRGQCAQSCRLPYDLIVDDEPRDLGDVRYLLSPKDLAGFRAVPGLMQVGVHTLKIEGRQKGPAYVATAVQGMRNWVDALASGDGATRDDVRTMSKALLNMQLSFSRGFSDGFLAGSDHQTLVQGRFPKHRGVLLGRVVDIDPSGLVRVHRSVDPAPKATGKVSSPLPALGGDVEASSGAQIAELSPKPGMGVVFDAGRPEDKNEAGGRLTSIQGDGEFLALRLHNSNLASVKPGQRVWVTSDPTLTKQTQKLSKHETTGQIDVDLEVFGTIGQPLKVRARSGHIKASAQTQSELAHARGDGLHDALLKAKLGAFGGTPFRLKSLFTAGLEPGLHVPPSQLKAVRRTIAEALVTQLNDGPKRDVHTEPVLDTLLHRHTIAPLVHEAPVVLPLCRTDAQLDAVIEAGLKHVELDWMEMIGLAKAVARAREAGLNVTIATVRIQKPGEEGYDRHIRRLKPDGVLVRHWGALMHFAHGNVPEEERPKLHGDFSLNVTNALTAHHLLGFGLDTITTSYDLDETQLVALLEHVPTDRLTVAVHHHIPTFHTEHCVYSHTLSEGRDYKTCGRPCDKHQIALRDRNNKEHPVIADVECRNTVFNAAAQSAPSMVPKLIARGVRRFRVEFVRETYDEALKVVTGYRDLVAGQCTPVDLLKQISAHEQFGVTQGTMKTFW